ncbi:hypothetical protein LRP30_25040 [Bradyrhizobium sp. C-145]|uniref:hypothetical protein n=1 Tax=Bradyrhizobium sp. C-145 TaxID=574727 RepID=UPI00201B4B4D|nr:hypothetical protein [Bradyrhizobium sp. C-145]UQR60278.1 hypothetical protein LRP30_25040 [Bradyrhizobium sp. C-145]
MLLFGARRPVGSRLQTLRELYASFIGENSPEARGRHLLRAWLSPVQLAQFDEHRYFDVVGCDTAKRYRINYGTAANVHELDGAGTPRVGWCFAPSARLVPGDVMLAQKIALETNENAVLAVANEFPPRMPFNR